MSIQLSQSEQIRYAEEQNSPIQKLWKPQLPQFYKPKLLSLLENKLQNLVEKKSEAQK
jgi:hypothetical protein